MRQNGLRKLARLLQVRRRGFAPHQIGIWRIGQRPRDRRLYALANNEQSLFGPLAGHELVVVEIGIARQQTRALRIRPRHDQRRHPHHIGRQPSRNQPLHRFLGRNQNLPPRCPHFFAEDD